MIYSSEICPFLGKLELSLCACNTLQFIIQADTQWGLSMNASNERCTQTAGVLERNRCYTRVLWKCDWEHWIKSIYFSIAMLPFIMDWINHSCLWEAEKGKMVLQKYMDLSFLAEREGFISENSMSSPFQ